MGRSPIPPDRSGRRTCKASLDDHAGEVLHNLEAILRIMSSNSDAKWFNERA